MWKKTVDFLFSRSRAFVAGFSYISAQFELNSQDKFGNYVYDVRNVDPKQFPKFQEAKAIEWIQEEGETIFVPSGWSACSHN